ncbi:uncharacterized protein LOC129577161 [Sitodiplosis mosellana]|uniref:uncharacterized protein LOC129577161 n=1 Tax=Sitodiplosis mosellana TaxID=263140 RepID=UPI0024444EBF|nr:uncharacterized protein LOC129577161 [Sitodiplosis mosellana]XP_055319711.1 uncharacterized protein LOC129577161 [Sitodiplosis mosellana]XP_055319712.1 uncharacterized protein LOC129577161 [Sitodiplosis mosellana]
MKMRKPIVNECCCNFKLNPGGYILGWSVVVVFTVCLFLSISVMVEKYPDWYQILNLIYISIGLMVFILWLIGIYRERVLLMKPAIFWAIFSVFFGLTKLGLSIAGYDDPVFRIINHPCGENEQICTYIISISNALILTGFSVYLTVVMYSVFVLINTNNRFKLQISPSRP